MTRAYITTLAQYNNHTDRLIMDWLSQISEEQWNQPLTSSFASIRQTAIHMVSAKKVWIDFWTKAPHPVYLSGVFNGTRKDLIELWESTSADLQSVIDNYPEEAYQQPVTFMYPDGRQGQMLFWQTLLHFVNHATYHRGQLVTLLRQAGFTNFTNTDMAGFFMAATQ
ncbi:putative damage-inducible protein DinB [Filimonas zeae]|uniref:Damage-inducible protein DinB n=1 Tax=Filimonas zeae TaxID=1737353 RepID=A0A917IUE4_9BACT|nr:DinB family protein [Filimonas zeae]MDR6339575.1 putative damage-inducible protein DinB [Filimonas zeae]GGH62973.1 hypothetical protein GCM10011379_13360 [Filimonas zeae]